MHANPSRNDVQFYMHNLLALCYLKNSCSFIIMHVDNHCETIMCLTCVPICNNIRGYVCLFNPMGSVIQTNRQDKYSFDTNSVALVFLLTRSHWCPIVPPGQPEGDRRSTNVPVSHPMARPQSTNKPRTASESPPQG